MKEAAATVMEYESVRLNPPPVPVTTIGLVLAIALAVAVTVIVTGAAAVMVGEENVAVTPEGSPLAASVTGELKPPCALMVNVEAADPPGLTVRLEEFDAREKFDALALLQLLTSRKASTEPSPVTKSYPVPAL